MGRVHGTFMGRIASEEALKNYRSGQLAASALGARTNPVLGAGLPNELVLLATFFRASIR